MSATTKLRTISREEAEPLIRSHLLTRAWLYEPGPDEYLFVQDPSGSKVMYRLRSQPLCPIKRYTHSSLNSPK